MRKFTFTRSAIVSETFVINAETEAEAWELVRDGRDPVSSEFVDYYTDDFVLEDGEDTPLTSNQ
jgi:hypothetical protein